MVGTGLGAKRGVLFKNAMALETSARINTVVMDKTGTLTKGEPEVTDLVTNGIDEDELLQLVAAVERTPSTRWPRPSSVRRQRGVDIAHAQGFENVPGYGAIATVDGHRVVSATGDSPSVNTSTSPSSRAPRPARRRRPHRRDHRRRRQSSRAHQHR